MSDVYGFALGEANGKLYAAISSKSGLVRQFEITAGSSVTGKAVRDMHVSGQVEGIEVDGGNGTIYVASETGGLYKFKADPATGNTNTTIATIGQNGLAADAEGVSIYDLGAAMATSCSQARATALSRSMTVKQTSSSAPSTSAACRTPMAWT
ncbi:phytase [Microvirga aerilata]|uniref:phytase n=1 Tax=Microvirga aerilata TaxID=670292 RepID=UPI003630909A